ncbi:MAG: peptidase M3, partial [Roseibium sp.]
MTANPLLTEWNTPFELPPFSEIEPAHFTEAFEAAMAQARAEINAIADNAEAPTFDNTIQALETSGELLSRAARTFYNLSGAHTNPDLQAIERDMAPKFAKHGSETFQNEALFQRIAALWSQRGELGLDEEQARVLERYHTMFQRAGAGLDADGKSRMAEISQNLASIGTQFAQNVLKDEADYKLVLESEEDLAGLPDFLIAAAAEAAAERGLEGKYVITLS